MTRSAAGVLCAIVTTLGAAVPASATTLTGKVDPPGAGTTAAPKAHTVVFDTRDIKKGSDGNPSVATVSLEQIVPKDFISGLDQYGTCDKSKITRDRRSPTARPTRCSAPPR